MAYVKVFPRGNTPEDRDKALEQALKAFKRQVEREGIIKDLRKREEYIPPSVQKRIRKKEAIKRANKYNARRRRFFRDK